MATSFDWPRVLDSEGCLALVISAASGVLFHVLVLCRTPVEEFMYSMLGAGLVTVGASFAGQVANGFSLHTALVQITAVTGTFLAGLFSSMLIYRGFFHRLQKFPGPFGAKLSRFWSCGRAAKNVQYYKEVEKMVDQYGDFVRTGPRELCVVRKEAIPLLYGPNTNCAKTTWYAQGDVDGDKSSLHMNRDKASHRRRRRAWDRSFSVKALNSYVPRILSKVDQFLEQVSDSSTPLDATKWTMFLSFDIMGEVGFRQNFECLTTGNEHPAIKCIHDHMEVLGILGHIPWFLNIVPRIPGMSKAYTPFFKYCGDAIDFKRKTINLGEEPQDVASWFIKAFNEKDVSASPTLKSLHEDSRALIIAGSDTTATTMAWIFYFLSTEPRVLAKLQAEVDAVMPNEKIGANDGWNAENLRNIPYIDAIICEALRLRPATLTGGYRETPPQGLTIDGTFVPGGVNVFVPYRQIQTDPRYWPEGKQFIPERWTEKRQEWGTDDAPYVPFSTGLNSCPGKNLALLTMRIALSRFAQKCSVAFAPGEDGEEFDKGAKDTFTTTLLPLKLDFQRRTK